MSIYKKIGYTDNEMSDMIRLRGDLYYSQEQYDVAMRFYRKSYDSISKQSNIDYDILTKIVNRIAAYEVQNGDKDDAINLYQSTINELNLYFICNKNYGDTNYDDINHVILNKHIIELYLSSSIACTSLRRDMTEL